MIKSKDELLKRKNDQNIAEEKKIQDNQKIVEAKKCNIIKKSRKQKKCKMIKMEKRKKNFFFSSLNPPFVNDNKPF